MREAAQALVPEPTPDPAAVPATTARVVNIANGLTLLRLLLVPVFVALLFADGGHATGWRGGAGSNVSSLSPASAIALRTWSAAWA